MPTAHELQELFTQVVHAKLLSVYGPDGLSERATDDDVKSLLIDDGHPELVGVPVLEWPADYAMNRNLLPGQIGAVRKDLETVLQQQYGLTVSLKGPDGLHANLMKLAD